MTRIAILGDFNPAYSTHHALNDSVRQMTNRFGNDLQFDWIGTDVFQYRTAFNDMYTGLWIAPGSPYKDMQNVIDTITFVRQNNIPTLGNCGGFQHMIIEFARNVCGIVGADHEETNPDGEELVISKLSCSLVEQQEELTLTNKQSLLYSILQKDRLLGKYYCSYGLNEKYIDTLKANGLILTALSPDNQVRAFELKDHSFFLGTLFQPALTSTPEQPDPVIVSFVEKCMNGIN